MNVFFREIDSYRRSTYIWIAALSTLVVVFMFIFPAFTSDVETAKKALVMIPPVLRESVGLSLTNFFTIFGFFGYILTFVSLAGAIQAMNLGVNIISKEESGKTADFLFSKPISRIKILTCKILASFWLIISTNVIFSLVSLSMAMFISKTEFSSRTFLLLSLILFFIQLIFLALGLLFAVIIPKIKSAISVTLPTVFSFFIIGTLGAVLGSDVAKNLSPFKFFERDYIITNGYYDTKYLLISTAIILVSLIICYIVYIKKDIKAAA